MFSSKKVEIQSTRNLNMAHNEDPKSNHTNTLTAYVTHREMGLTVTVNLTFYYHLMHGAGTIAADMFIADIVVKVPSFEGHMFLFTPGKPQPYDFDSKSRLVLSYSVQCRNLEYCGSMCNKLCNGCSFEDSDDGHYECDWVGNRLCLPGWTDPSAECLIKSPCFDNPCMNGGTCTEMEDNLNFWCDCPTDFEGFLCETCTKCGNHGICIYQHKATLCLCDSYYGSERCKHTVKPCDINNQPCKNGGTCFNIPGGYLCNCARGYTGINCLEDVDECRAQILQEGQECC